MPILVALSGTNFSVYPVLCLPSCHSTPLEVWFARVESQFGTKQITVDKPKFDYVVSSLDSTTAGEVEAILIAPPNDKYDVLKAALLAAFGKAQAQKDSELTSITGHGDMNTSALLRRLQSLNSDPKTLFRAHFLVDFYLQSHPHSLNLFWLLVVIQNDKMNLFLIKKENGRRSGWHDGVYFITESTVSAVSAVSAFGDCRRIINKTKLLNVGR